MRWRHNVPGREWDASEVFGPDSGRGPDQPSPRNRPALRRCRTRGGRPRSWRRSASSSASRPAAAGRQILHGVDQAGEVPAEAVELPDDDHIALAQGALAAVESRPVVPDTGRQVAVDVGLVDAGRLHAALRVQRLRAVGLRGAGAGRIETVLAARRRVHGLGGRRHPVAPSGSPNTRPDDPTQLSRQGRPLVPRRSPTIAPDGTIRGRLSVENLELGGWVQPKLGI